VYLFANSLLNPYTAMIVLLSRTAQMFGYSLDTKLPQYVPATMVADDPENRKFPGNPTFALPAYVPNLLPTAMLLMISVVPLCV
jgi:hypothetical protein